MRVRAALDLLGYRRDAEDDGQAGMLDDLRDFQKDHGLKIDGLMNPGGPTEKKIGERLAAADPADAPVFPQGDTVDRRLRSLMEDPRYPADTRLRKHVERQFEKAYPGEVAFDELGRMQRPLAEITPAEISPFDPGGVLARARMVRYGISECPGLDLAQRIDPADYAGGAETSEPSEELLAETREAFRAAKGRQDASDAWEKGLLPEFAGGDQRAFEAAARRLGELREKDGEAYDRLSADTRAVHRAYETSREAYEPIKKKALELGLGSEEELNARYDKEAFEVAMHVGALRNTGHAFFEPGHELIGRAGEARDLVETGKIDTDKFDARMKEVESAVPPGYRNAGVYGLTREAGEMTLGKLAAPVKTASEGVAVADAITRAGGDVEAGMDLYLQEMLLYKGGTSALKRMFSDKSESNIRKLLQGLGEDMADEAMSKRTKKRAFNRGMGDKD